MSEKLRKNSIKVKGFYDLSIAFQTLFDLKPLLIFKLISHIIFCADSTVFLLEAGVLLELLFVERMHDDVKYLYNKVSKKNLRFWVSSRPFDV